MLSIFQKSGAPAAPVQESFIERHFATIAFAVSTLALFIFSALAFFLATAIGYALNFYMDPTLKLKPTDKIVTIPNALFTIIGATGALLKLTPAGATGGFLFQWIPFLATLAVGSTLYRAIRNQSVI